MAERLAPQRTLGPGPGAYMLPPTIGHQSHDIRKERSPMFTFGNSQPRFKPSINAGLASYNHFRSSFNSPKNPLIIKRLRKSTSPSSKKKSTKPKQKISIVNVTPEMLVPAEN
ncbi:hypothetical protein ACFFRR_006859 [Megaselia abdita]